MSETWMVVLTYLDGSKHVVRGLSHEEAKALAKSEEDDGWRAFGFDWNEAGEMYRAFDGIVEGQNAKYVCNGAEILGPFQNGLDKDVAKLVQDDR